MKLKNKINEEMVKKTIKIAIKRMMIKSGIKTK
jgi:hypothetical protein